MCNQTEAYKEAREEYGRGYRSPNSRPGADGLTNTERDLIKPEGTGPFDAPEQRGLYKLAVAGAQGIGIAEEALNLLDGLYQGDIAGGYSRKAVRKRYKELRRRLDDLTPED